MSLRPLCSLFPLFPGKVEIGKSDFSQSLGKVESGKSGLAGTLGKVEIGRSDFAGKI